VDSPARYTFTRLGRLNREAAGRGGGKGVSMSEAEGAGYSSAIWGLESRGNANPAPMASMGIAAVGTPGILWALPAIPLFNLKYIYQEHDSEDVRPACGPRGGGGGPSKVSLGMPWKACQGSCRPYLHSRTHVSVPLPWTPLRCGVQIDSGQCRST